MTFPREPLPTWRYPTRISGNHFVSFRPAAGSFALRRATTPAANPCLRDPSSFQTVLPPSLEQIYSSHGPVLPLLNRKIHQLHALVLPVLPLRFPIIFCNSGLHFRATSRPPRLGFPYSKGRSLALRGPALPAQTEQ